MAENYDVIIIGSGPGGYVAAIRAAQLGMKTAIVEREHLGGICLNWGCIPTKALLRSAEIMDYASHAKNYGLKIEGKVTADVGEVMKRSRGVSQRLNGGVGFLMKKNKIDVIWGEAKLAGKGKITVAIGRVERVFIGHVLRHWEHHAPGGGDLEEEVPLLRIGHIGDGVEIGDQCAQVGGGGDH